MKLDIKAAGTFLELWFNQCPRGQYLEIRPLNKRPGMRPLPQQWVSDAEAALRVASQCVDHGDDVYIGALPRGARSGGENAVGARVWLWGDVDFGAVGHKTPSVHGDREAALAAIRSCAIEPTAIV